MDVREQLASTPYENLDPIPNLPSEAGPEPTARIGVRLLAVPAALFLLTLVTTTLANGLAYGLCVMAILLAHEMGHYLMCRRYRVPSTLPYFIPLPPQISFLGTLGAVIRMRLRTAERSILYDIGIAGPLAGLILAIPAAWWGLAHSHVTAGPALPGGLSLGESLAFRLLTRVALGNVSPTDVVILHPVALAGWTGLFVTGLNLIPVGMLDGGHVTYGLLGPRSYWVALVSMGLLAVLAASVFPGWWVWFVLLLLLGVRHPASRFLSPPVGRSRVLLGIFALVVFALCFVPRPFDLSP